MRFFRDLTRRDRDDPPAGEADADDLPFAEPPAADSSVERPRLADTARTLAEVSREMAHWVPILRRLAEAEQLRDLALGHTSEINGAAIRSIINARRLRDQYFWPAMSEAAWALLLELFANRLQGERLDVAGLSAVTDIPLASALHWIEWLSGRGMVVRNGPGENAENPLVALTEAGADEMRAYLLAALRLSPWVQ
ncbi:MAG: hypothetical protein QOD42_1025 [Sphingomonadales bacterium]|jgi:hypothetical protein|nr:hypothetical protein [Sphingomonadales bacterium]